MRFRVAAYILVSMVALSSLPSAASFGGQPLDGCPSFDGDHDGQVDVTELIQAVNAALRGCGVQ